MLKLAKRLALVALLIAGAGTAASPVRILIAYHSQTGNTAKLAAAVREGAASVAGVEVLLRSVDEAGTEDIVKSDGILLGTPVHWGNLSAESKRFLDRTALVESDQIDVAFDRFDHGVHLPVQYLFGEAEGEAFGRMEGNMRRQRQCIGIDHHIHHDGTVFVR